jgi:transglutaminase-like putative cysteine protease
MNMKSVLCIALLGASAAFAVAAADAPRSRDFDFTYTAHITELPADAHQVDVWLPYPTSDANQDVTVTEVTAPFKHEVVTESRFGNSILHLAVTDPKVPGFDVEMKVHVRRKEYLHNAFASLKTDSKAARPADVAMWLKPDRLVPNDDNIRDLAREVTKGKQGDLAKARAIYD